ncbi:hypothetical protein B296_00030684 [Ensete ventricosum]|uniref:Uncharacterized protein n=1 Tax=Ensete ventricosum TaxID=4639 RepID=A0A426Z7W1_ENSVE|nr:hypothetical protein B296_00030684 [Ensete ventricosum]
MHGTGGTYRSTRLPVCGPPATGRYHQNRSLTVDFDRRWSIEAINHRWSIEGEKGKKKKKKRRRRKKKTSFPRAILAHAPSPPTSRPRDVVARGSPMRHPRLLAILLPREEKDRGDLRRYEEVIVFCEQTNEIAERNYALCGVSTDNSEDMQSCPMRLWRLNHISKSYFYLGRFEEAVELLKKHEQVKYKEDKYCSKSQYQIHLLTFLS